MKKTSVYNGYKEKYLNGISLKNMYRNSYFGDFRHKSTFIALKIPVFLDFLQIKDDEMYHIFYNEHFCRIMTEDTDTYISFFSHATIEQIKLSKNFSSDLLNLPEKCPLCGANMIIKRGRFGFFLSCVNYPSCKGSSKIPIIGSSYGLTTPPEMFHDDK